MQKEIFELMPLFQDVQMASVFKDGKTFVDCTPKQSTAQIESLYASQKTDEGFNLKDFVLLHFEMPKSFSPVNQLQSQTNIEQHIYNLWPLLTRRPDEARGSLIPLPYPYIVPGGRFGEVYYWDSYFTMLGLRESGLHDMIENMVNNFTHLIQTIGYIPNGNRTYYIGRSQPPFYALMVALLADINGKQLLPTYLGPLLKEYDYWMKGAALINNTNTAAEQVVLMPGGELLNRYWDTHDTPRPESYREDVELTHHSAQPANELYRNLRAGAASGWDYSSRWFKHNDDFGSIHTSRIVPVDLNSLLYYLEQTIAAAQEQAGNLAQSAQFRQFAENRKIAIRKYCWNAEKQFYVDYDLDAACPKQAVTLAGMVPLFFNLASQQEADAAATIIEQQFLKPGGLVTTLAETGQQWDAPNGWAPLQWMAVLGLENFGHHKLATTIAQRWIALTTAVFNRTGKLMEKYNVINTQLEAGGGEYEGQDGFGWSNGVLLALCKKYGTVQEAE